MGLWGVLCLFVLLLILLLLCVCFCCCCCCVVVVFVLLLFLLWQVPFEVVFDFPVLYVSRLYKLRG